MQTQNIEKIVSEILDDVATNRDKALISYSEKFDNCILKENELLINVSDFEIELKNIKPDVLEALKIAAENIKFYHEAQALNIFNNSFKISKNDCEIYEKISPIENVGVYVPGGKFSYPSTVLMTVIPALCAGVKNIIVATPMKNITPLVKVALFLSGATKVLPVGGAQAIAAMAFGTESINKVDMIVGPGNSFVTEAKRQVYGKVGIDSLAGPSDILIYADNENDIDWILADMQAQAEHDTMAGSIVVSENKKLIDNLNEILIKSNHHLAGKFNCELKNNLDSCIDYINNNAPEHLEILVDDKEKTNFILDNVKHAGAIFVGKYSTVAFGDYFLGPSHTLPTNSNARFSSGLSVNTFLKRSAVMSINENFVKLNADYVSTLALEEGLKFHSESIKIRLNNVKK